MDKQTTCPMPDENPPAEEIAEILQNTKTIAIVGLSDNPEKDSNRVARYLIEHGYEVIPVNPLKKEILGKKSYPDLTSIPEKVDVVDIFRPVEAIPSIVEEAIKVGAKVVWMQLGLSHPEAAQKARNAGLKAVQSKCIKIEHSKIYHKEAGMTFNLME
ncbi:MAG: CoA-binding protein [Spirochaetes bacterium]|nr:CoA-binding protein [Spirochaetota bacterium]